MMEKIAKQLENGGEGYSKHVLVRCLKGCMRKGKRRVTMLLPALRFLTVTPKQHKSQKVFFHQRYEAGSSPI